MHILSPYGLLNFGSFLGVADVALTIDSQIFTSSGTWTKPAGAVMVLAVKYACLL